MRKTTLCLLLSGMMACGISAQDADINMQKESARESIRSLFLQQENYELEMLYKKDAEKLSLLGISKDSVKDYISRDIVPFHAIKSEYDSGRISQDVLSMMNDFGIRNIQRYSLEMIQELMRNHSGISSDLPLALILNGSNPENDSLVSSPYDNLIGKYRVIISEPDTDVTFLDKVNRFGKEFGRIDLLLIGGHGGREGINLGEYDANSGRSVWDYDLDKYDEEKILSSGISKYLSSSTIILQSCSGGKIEGIGENLAQFMKRLTHAKEVYGAQYPTNLEDLEIMSTGVVPVYLRNYDYPDINPTNRF